MIAWYSHISPSMLNRKGCFTENYNHKLELRLPGEITTTSDIFTDDTTLMAESEEELKSLLMKVEEENEKAGLKLSVQKTKILASSPITSWQIFGEAMETGTDYFLGPQNHCEW